jgi:hypothetical protein
MSIQALPREYETQFIPPNWEALFWRLAGYVQVGQARIDANVIRENGPLEEAIRMIRQTEIVAFAVRLVEDSNHENPHGVKVVPL